MIETHGLVLGPPSSVDNFGGSCTPLASEAESDDQLITRIACSVMWEKLKRPPGRFPYPESTERTLRTTSLVKKIALSNPM